MALRQVDLAARPLEGFRDLVDPAAYELGRERGARFAAHMAGRTVWNVNSTPAGGGVAEMLHPLVGYARGVGVDTRWVVIEGTPEFFARTKQLHNALHGGSLEAGFAEAARAGYEETAERNAEALAALLGPDDVVILHDPQTAGMAPRLRARCGVLVWRCHVVVARGSEPAARAWRFLAPYLEDVDAMVFSRSGSVPPGVDPARLHIIPPSIDPLSAKNQPLAGPAVQAILARSGLVGGGSGDGEACFRRADGSRGRVERAAEVLRDGPPPGPDQPLVVQVSRWDRLKDPLGVVMGFAELARGGGGPPAALVLAGPSARSVDDDPEQAQVLDEVRDGWRSLPAAVRQRVQLASLPMEDAEENAAIVNALQRHAAIVVQKSLAEGFGLTVTEAMWKARPVVASAVGGIRDQIAHGESGLLLEDPRDRSAFAAALARLLGDPPFAARLGARARERVRERYLGLRSLVDYAELVESIDARRGAGAAP